MIAIFFSFNFFLLSKIFFLLLYLASLMIIGLDFSPFLEFLMQCVLSISLSLKAKSKCSFIALIHSSSVFCYFSGIPCSSKQLCLEYCSCFSTASERSPTFCANLDTISVNLLLFFLLFFFLVCMDQTSW